MHLKDKSDESFISINCLEYVTIILNYCASLVVFAIRKVKRLHAEYRSYASGKGSRMLNDARVMQLHEVGFQFV
jgi:hypothetical protein